MARVLRGGLLRNPACRGFPQDWWFAPVSEDTPALRLLDAAELCDSCGAAAVCAARAVGLEAVGQEVVGLWGGWWFGWSNRKGQRGAWGLLVDARKVQVGRRRQKPEEPAVAGGLSGRDGVDVPA